MESIGEPALSDEERAKAQWLAGLPVAPDSIECYGHSAAEVIEWYGDPEDRPICFLHGGHFHDDALPATRPAARALSQAGYYVGLADYRLVAGRPELTAHDYMALGMHPILGQAIWVGHDAGGTFAMNVVLAPETQVRTAILLAPVLDLACDARGGAGQINPLIRWIGGTPEDHPERYALYDPLFTYYQVGSARFRARNLSLSIIHGVDDSVVDVDWSREVRGEPFNLAVLEGADHIDLIHPDHDAWVYFLGALASVA